jgi:hypothetical protein
VLITGFSATVTPERLREAGVSEMLEKPHTADQLAAVVRRNLPVGQVRQ